MANIKLNLISEERITEQYDYDETVRTYSCPCGKGKVIWSKERPNGHGTGYQATFSDVFCQCDDCKTKYDFDRIKGYATVLK